MKAQVQVFFEGDGGEQLTPPVILPTASAEFAIGEFLKKIGEGIYHYFNGKEDEFQKDVENGLKQLGGDVKDSKSAEVSFSQRGDVPGADRPVSLAVVYFHTWTGDDIKPSFGKVAPNPSGIIRDLGEYRYTKGDFQYEYRFLVPLATTPVGKYMFAFGIGDSGTLQDATIGYTVGMTITPPSTQPSIEERRAQLVFLGNPTSDEQSTPDGIGRYRHFQNGSIYWTPGRGAHEVHGSILEKWKSLGWERSVLGYPLTDETSIADNIGRFNHFQYGSIYWTPNTGAFEVHGAIRNKWASLGWETSFLGYPITDELGAPDGSRYQNFQGGSIRWSPKTGAVESQTRL